ncbi:hypothetical protein PENTCL1PPCAC_16559, partial [Pristionchus entomophagus]
GSAPIKPPMSWNFTTSLSNFVCSLYSMMKREADLESVYTLHPLTHLKFARVLTRSLACSTSELVKVTRASAEPRRARHRNSD